MNNVQVTGQAIRRPRSEGPPVITWALIFIALVSAVASTIVVEAIFLSGLCMAIALFSKPQYILGFFLLFHWSQYIPKIGKVIEKARVNLGPVSVTPHDVFFGIIFIVIARAIIARPIKTQFLFKSMLGKAILLFFLYQGVQAFWCVVTGVPLDSVIRESAKYMVCFYAFFIYFYFDSESIKPYFKLAFWLIMSLPIFQSIMIATGEVWKTSSGTDRTYYIGVNIFFLGIIVFQLARQKFTMQSIFIIIYMMAGMAMTQYRSAFLAFLAVVGLVGIYYFRDGKINRIVFGGTGMFVALSVAVLVLSFVRPEFISQTVTRYSDTFNTQDMNAQSRSFMWGVSWDAFLSKPIAGVGVANSIYSFAGDNSIEAQKQWSPHNFVMRILAKEGIIGFGLLVYLLWAMFKMVRGRRGSALYGEEIRRTMSLFMAAIIIVNLMNTTFTATQSNFVLWFMAGFMLMYLWERKITLQAMAANN